jgi:23S rRNA (guanine2445-N2)-methyltransferase / 23S rRNA (guanine2069-N7)-methyltransferase
LGVYAKRTHRVFNGDLECRLLRFDLDAASAVRPREAVRADWAARAGAQMFANRLRKNLSRLEPWAERERIECFRLYDADMPEYAFAIDLYGREPRHVYVQEYAAPRTVDPESARERRREVLSVIPDVLAVPLTRLHSRLRKPQKGVAQYERRAATKERHVVHEGGLKFWVNFRDYLDTGLFLDHRLIRGWLREAARGADVLNLFCYTGSATVYAAAGGARSSCSVDLSNTYLEWAQENLLLNGFGGSAHRLVRADCLDWLEEQGAGGPRFDLIFVDPPTFSNSKKMTGVLDVQRDHVGMIRRSLRLLRTGGRLIFSTNFAKFKLDGGALCDLRVIDMSAETIPKDFERHARIHRCFLIAHQAGSPPPGA